MPTAKTTSSRAKAAPASKGDDSAALAAKVEALEASLAALQKELAAHCKQSEAEHAALLAKCDACCAAASKDGSSDVEERVAQIWAWLRRDRGFRYNHKK